MARPLTKSQKNKYMMLVSRAFLDGAKTQKEIAEMTGIGDATVSRYLAELREDWRSEAKDNIGEAIQEQIATLRAVMQEAWDAWKRSTRQKTKKVTTEFENNPSGSRPNETRTEKWKEVGDPRYLAQIERCVAKISELLGLMPSTKIDLGKETVKTFADWVQEMGRAKEIGE